VKWQSAVHLDFSGVLATPASVKTMEALLVTDGSGPGSSGSLLKMVGGAAPENVHGEAFQRTLIKESACKTTKTKWEAAFKWLDELSLV
jgi:hypothetical protein